MRASLVGNLFDQLDHWKVLTGRERRGLLGKKEKQRV
jgi:hypothetical protein